MVDDGLVNLMGVRPLRDGVPLMIPGARYGVKVRILEGYDR